jgi:chemotaxis protein MotB
MADSRPIIVIKKKVTHGGHHGGAWKVAYADFVTAMMALFIVLWLMNTSKKVQEAVGGYFKDPSGTSQKGGSGMHGSGDAFQLTKDTRQQLKEELQKKVRQMNEFEHIQKQVEMTVTAEGLRIELMEAEVGTFFPMGATEPNDSGREILAKLAEEIGKLPNKLSIEGHTDSKPFGPNASYTNWELSTDRGNAARRLLQANGMRPDQVSQVRGYADQRLKKPENPLDPANRRISLIVQYLDKDMRAAAEEEEKEGENKKSTNGHGESEKGAHGEAKKAPEPTPAARQDNAKTDHAPHKDEKPPAAKKGH